jgi:hypothetical protein
MGFWNATQAENVEVRPEQEVLTKVTAPYGEFFVSAGLKKGFALEFSAGSYYRGETRYTSSFGSYWIRVSLYPITGELKFYPLSSVRRSKLQPYVDAGLALVSGIENVRLGQYVGPSLLVDSGTNSYLTVGWHVGGGAEFNLSRLFVIGADVKYRAVKFGDKVGGLKDYSGPEAALGISYVLKGI